MFEIEREEERKGDRENVHKGIKYAHSIDMEENCEFIYKNM